MGKIATREFCNTLKSGSFGSELNRCPTKQELLSAGFGVNGDYTDEQLVMEEDIRVYIGIITVGANGAIYKKPY